MRPFLLVLLVLTTGCRTYGGFGSEDATRVQIAQAADRYAAHTARMQADMDALSVWAAGDPARAGSVRAFGMLLADQEALLVRHAQRAVDAERIQEYRALNASLGAMQAEQQVLDDRLARFTAGLGPTLERPFDPARYAVVPALLARLEQAALRMPVRDAIR